jgi:uncharacterized RDD family membrane protein YckC
MEPEPSEPSLAEPSLTEPSLDFSESPPPFSPPPPLPPKGGFWRRSLAYSFDLIVLQLIYAFFITIGTAAVDLATAQTPVFELGDSTFVTMAGSFMGLWTVLFVLYFTFFPFWGGQTPGKMLMRLRVVTYKQVELSLLRSLARSLSYFLSSLFLGVGFLMAALNRDKRALHDFIAQTYVVRV